MTTALLLVAAGSGSRTGSDIPKQYWMHQGRPLLTHVLEQAIAYEAIDLVQVVTGEGQDALYSNALNLLPTFSGWENIGKILPPVEGGLDRQGSVLNGLKSLAEYEPDIALIHDAARAFTPDALFTDVIEEISAGADGAAPFLPVTDSLHALARGRVSGPVDRSSLRAVQTPQGFRYPAILSAHQNAAPGTATDDVALARAAGLSIAMVDGSPLARKITTTDDFTILKALMAAEIPPDLPFRTGQGFDVHAFDDAPADAITLCGIDIPFGRRLKGHSDADVALHALTDALLGAIGDGDIGSHFPPSDPQWKGAASDQFLIHAVKRCTARGYRIGNVDVTLMCERPKLGPHRDACREKIAGLLGVATDQVSVKATTTERLGFTGREEGIACLASVLLIAE